jgi:hypothetical protein
LWPAGRVIGAGRGRSLRGWNAERVWDGLPLTVLGHRRSTIMEVKNRTVEGDLSVCGYRSASVEGLAEPFCTRHPGEGHPGAQRARKCRGRAARVVFWCPVVPPACTSCVASGHPASNAYSGNEGLGVDRRSLVAVFKTMRFL